MRLLLLLAACGSEIVGNVTCASDPCGGNVTGSWFAGRYCDDPTASGLCANATANGALTFNDDKSYTASLRLDCPAGTQSILHDGKGTWSTSGTLLTLSPSGGAPFNIPYCVIGTTLVTAKTGSSLYATWTRPSR